MLLQVTLQQEDAFIREFKTIHESLHSTRDLATVDAVKYVEPFLSVISSQVQSRSADQMHYVPALRDLSPTLCQCSHPISSQLHAAMLKSPRSG